MSKPNNAAPQPKTPLTCKERMPEPGETIFFGFYRSTLHTAVVERYDNQHGFIYLRSISGDQHIIHSIDFVREHGIYVSRADGKSVTEGSKRP